MARTIGLTVVLCAALALAARATTHVVDVTGVESGSYLTIQEGIDAAFEGDTVRVFPGAYIGDGNRDLHFGAKNIVLRSTSGSGTTVIDNQADGGHRLFNFYAGGQDTTCVVDGFTIQGGRFLQPGDCGAGIRIEGPTSPPSPKFTNCVIRNNHGGGGSGGGVYVNNLCSPVFENCTFESNTALLSGGGFYCAWSNPRLENVTFTSNHASLGFGGGLACNNYGNASVHGAWFEGNTSGDQGGAFGSYQSAPTVVDAVFLNNLATTDGGAIYVQKTSAAFTNCTFAKNRSPGEGSVYYAWSTSNPAFDRCIFAFSHEDGTSTFYCDGASTPTIHHCCSFANPDGNDVCGSVDGIIFEDPLFCNINEDDLTLASDSPCLPAGNPWSDSLGALGQGCTQSPVETRTWGAIKAMFR